MSYRDHADLGTHLSPENRGSYVREADVHLSLRSFRDPTTTRALYPPAEALSTTSVLRRGTEAPGKILPATGARRITHLSDFSRSFYAGVNSSSLEISTLFFTERATGHGARVSVDLEDPLYRGPIFLIGGEVEDLLAPLPPPQTPPRSASAPGWAASRRWRWS